MFERGAAVAESILGPFIDSLPDGVLVSDTAGQIVAANEQLCELSGHAREALVGANVETLIPGQVRARHVALRTSYIAGGGPTRRMSDRLDIVMLRADGTALPVDVSLTTIEIGGEQLAVAAVRDATFRRRAELKVEQERAFMTAVHAIAAALLAGDHADDTLRTIAVLVRELLESDLAILAVPTDDGQSVAFRVCEGVGADALEGSLVPFDASVTGSVMRAGELVLLADASGDKRLHRPEGWPADVGPALFAPLQARDEVLGSLVVARLHGGRMFHADDVARMTAFAAQAALALVDARRQESLRHLQLLEERDRVATQMHDSVVRRVSSASLTLHGLLQGERLDAHQQEQAWNAIEELDAAIVAIRSAVFPRHTKGESP